MFKAVGFLIGASSIYPKFITEPESRILEAATGFGSNLSIVLGLAEKLKAKVYSVDISQASISFNKIIYRSYIKKGVLTLEKGDLRALHYQDNFFNYAVNHTTMHHIDVDDIEKVLREHKRTLTKGGILIIVDLNPRQLIVHSPQMLLKAKEEVLRTVDNIFNIIEKGENKIAYYVVAVKS
ncbi:MAG: class I SAM-dependent methyltransferase [Thermoprotei archaeon]|nr:class I SAM-dependent methyltransferase [Thermoprotei archaeon]